MILILMIIMNMRGLAEDYLATRGQQAGQKVRVKGCCCPNYQDQELVRFHDSQIVNKINEKQYGRAKLNLQQFVEELKAKSWSRRVIITRYEMFVYHYNMTALYWKTKQVIDAGTSMSEAIISLSMILSECDSPEEQIHFTIETTKVLLQYCVILSHLGRHGEAVEVIENSIVKIFECLSIIEKMTDELAQEGKASKEKSWEKDHRNFRVLIVKTAKKKIKDLFEIEKWYQKVRLNEEEAKQKINLIYSWKANEGNNERQIRRAFSSCHLQERRNILGIQKSSQWLDDFNIGKVMVMQAKSLRYSVLNDRILEIFVLVSASFFTLSTEIRFRNLEESRANRTLSMKFLHMNQDKEIITCKILHLKAIEIAMGYFPASTKYSSHLIDSFHKNYKFFMEQIKEEESNLEKQGASKKPKSSKKGKKRGRGRAESYKKQGSTK